MSKRTFILHSVVAALNENTLSTSAPATIGPPVLTVSYVENPMAKAIEVHFGSVFRCGAVLGRSILGEDPVQRRTARLREDCAV